MLTSIGYVASKLDPCVLHKRVGNACCTVVLFVDDILLTATDDQLIAECCRTLKHKYGAITEKEGKVHNYLGMTFDFSTPGSVKVSMDGYVTETLDEFHKSGENACTLPQQ